MPPPANDDFADAQIITGLSGSVEGSTWFSTTETGEPDSSSGVWYSFTPPTSGIYKFILDRVYAGDWFKLFTGSDVMSLTEVTERDFTTSGGFDLNSGTTYYLRVNGNQTRFFLHWKYYAPAANDDFADATVLSGSSGTEPYVLITAGVESGDPDSHLSSGFSNATVWFKWVATATGTLRVFTENTYLKYLASDGVSAIGVYKGTSLESLTHITYAEFMWSDYYNYGGVDGIVNNIVDAAVVQGETYYIEVGNDSVPINSGGGLFHWHLYPSSVWDGEWGRPAIATPNPGTNATAFPTFVSGSYILSNFQGSEIPTTPDGDGFAWRVYSGSNIPTLTTDGLKGEVTSGSETVDFEWMTDSPDYDPVPGVYIPHEGGTWEVGFMTSGMKWLNSASEGDQYSEFVCQPIDLSFTIDEKGMLFNGDVPNPNFNSGWWFIADGRKYRYKVIYEEVEGVEAYGFPVETSYYLNDNTNLETYDASWQDSTLNIERGIIVGRTSGFCGARFSTTEPVDCDFTIKGFKLGNPLYMGLRVTSASGTDFDGYFAKIRTDGKISLLKRVSGAETTFGTTASVVFESNFNDSNHPLTLRCQGNEISVWHNDGWNPPKLLLSATDSTFSSAGHKALLIDSSGDFDSGIVRFGATATAAQSIVSRYRCYLSPDAGTTWELFNESILTSAQRLTYEITGGVTDFYLSDTTTPGWSITYEGWEPPPPEIPPDLATLPGIHGYFHNGEWHIMRSTPLI